MKICTKCNQQGEFFRDSRAKDGLQSQCKKCKSVQVKQYYRLHPERHHKRTKEEGRARHQRNKISNNFSRRMRASLNGVRKTQSWTELVDFTLDELKYHLEAQFIEGMSWSNYGEWHIDHIKPIDSFNITSTSCSDFRKCWKLSNLQPLWKYENISKGKKY